MIKQNLVNKTNPKVIGVVGGGQLAKMLIEASKQRKVEIIVQTSRKDDPAALENVNTVLAKADDPEGTTQLASKSTTITFENEWVNIDKLKIIEKTGITFIPPLNSIELLIDKVSQRKFLDEISIPGPKWIDLSSNETDISKLPTGWEFPIMAKARKGGYDGKGTTILKNYNELNEFLEQVDKKNWLLESWVNYNKELAIVVSRDKYGTIRTFPIVETKQIDQVCDWVLAPADVEHQVVNCATNIAYSLLSKLNYIGVIAIEFFYGPDGLQVNEIAPRTHNSAHYSIEACSSSQFDQQICIASDLKVPQPALVSNGALMINLLGLKNASLQKCIEKIEQIRKLDGAFVHWYNKKEIKPKRKLGHVTFLLKGQDAKSRKLEATDLIQNVRQIWPA